MKKVYILVFLVYLLTVSFATEFKFNFNESYRIESTVYQNVLFNRKIELSSVILNKYSVNLVENNTESAVLNINHHVFQESKGLASGFYTVHQSEKGQISQNIFGEIKSLGDPYFPAVQSVPVFPDRDIKIGESWTSTATEFFDLKNAFGIDDVISTTFRVFYTYKKDEIINGVEVAVIELNYNIYEKIRPYMDWGDFYPMKISGSSKQVLYWDIKKGRPHSVDDVFVLDFFTSTGDQYTFKGRTDSKSWPKNNLDDNNVKNMVTDLKQSPQTTVDETEEYLRITFNSLLFDAESWILKEDVKKYLDKIGSTLSKSEDINIRILGHTAIFGAIDEEYLNTLSTRRARSVAEYLLEKGYIDQNSIEILGKGGSEPVDTNDTAEGRSRNRRVEIDILKN